MADNGVESEVRGIQKEREKKKTPGDDAGSSFFGTGVQAQIGARRDIILGLYKRGSPNPFTQTLAEAEDILNDIIENRAVRWAAESTEKLFLSAFPQDESSLFTMADVLALFKAIAEGIRNPDTKELQKYSPKDLISVQIKVALKSDLESMNPTERAHAGKVIDQYAQNMVQKISQEDVPKVGSQQAFMIYNAVGDLMAQHLESGISHKDLFSGQALEKLSNKVFAGKYEFEIQEKAATPKLNPPEEALKREQERGKEAEKKFAKEKKTWVEKTGKTEKRLEETKKLLKETKGEGKDALDQMKSIEKDFAKSEKKLDKEIDAIHDAYGKGTVSFTDALKAERGAYKDAFDRASPK